MVSPNIAGQHKVLTKDYSARKAFLLLISFACMQLTADQVRRAQNLQ